MPGRMTATARPWDPPGLGPPASIGLGHVSTGNCRTEGEWGGSGTSERSLLPGLVSHRGDGPRRTLDASRGARDGQPERRLGTTATCQRLPKADPPCKDPANGPKPARRYLRSSTEPPFNGGAGIHGTDAVGSIGSAASHGCIRMLIPDVIDLYAKTPVHTPVYVA